MWCESVGRPVERRLSVHQTPSLLLDVALSFVRLFACLPACLLALPLQRMSSGEDDIRKFDHCTVRVLLRLCSSSSLLADCRFQKPRLFQVAPPKQQGKSHAYTHTHTNKKAPRSRVQIQCRRVVHHRRWYTLTNSNDGTTTTTTTTTTSSQLSIASARPLSDGHWQPRTIHSLRLLTTLRQ